VIFKDSAEINKKEKDKAVATVAKHYYCSKPVIQNCPEGSLNSFGPR
jgi:hypothetical protein